MSLKDVIKNNSILDLSKKYGLTGEALFAIGLLTLNQEILSVFKFEAQRAGDTNVLNTIVKAEQNTVVKVNDKIEALTKKLDADAGLSDSDYETEIKNI